MITAFKSLVEIIHTNIVNFRQSIAMSIIALRKRYSGTSFGTIWALVKPIVLLAYTGSVFKLVSVAGGSLTKRPSYYGSSLELSRGSLSPMFLAAVHVALCRIGIL